MEDLQRFISNLISEVLNRFRYGAIDAADRKTQELLNRKPDQKKDQP